jgi:CubicO group peptidase (beta-lactamase class C family)
MKRLLLITAVSIAAVVVVTGLVLFGLYLAAPKPKAPPSPISSVGDVERYLKTLTDNQTPPGLVVTILKEGNPVYEKAFGYADRPQRKPVRIDTIFPWWSVTKAFTATAIIQLCERGKINLEDPLEKYIPDFEVTDKAGNRKTITISQVLTHRSGLRDFMPEGLTWVRLAGLAKPNQTAFFKEKITGKYRILKSEPGTKASYSNIGYMALGVVVEAVTGQEYEDFISENILTPLNMIDTAFIRSEEQQRKTATGSNPVINLFTGLMWVFGPRGFFDTFVRETVSGRLWFRPLYTDYTPSTGLSGPSREMARFGQLFLQGGVFDDRRVLKQASVDEMLKLRSLDELPESYGKAEYGLGWQVWKVNDKIVYGHGGGGPGFGALLAIIPESDLVIAINANDTNIDRDRLLNLFMSMMEL